MSFAIGAVVGAGLAYLHDAGKQVDLVIFPGLDHQLPSSEARTRVLSQSDAFFRKTLGL